MSVRFDDIDLNSDAVPVDRNDEVGGGNTSSDSITRVDVSEPETLADRVGSGSVDRRNNLEVEMEHVDRENKMADVSVGGEFEASDVRVVLGDDSYLRDSIFSLKNEGEKDICVEDRRGESDFTGVEVTQNDEKLDAGKLGLDYGDGILIQPTVVGSEYLNDGVKHDSSVGLKSIDQPLDGNGERKLGSRVDNEGIGLEGEMDKPAHLSRDKVSCVNGFGSNGNQFVGNNAGAKDIEQAQKKVEQQADLRLESQVKECRVEKEGQFQEADLVWGKVRSHPWWPGQIFDPSDSSEKARRYRKKDGFLISYFGDHTFAWNEASRIKPFRMHFSQMEKQSTVEAFFHAVDCALEEVSRRAEFGLACSCLSEEVYNKIKTQIIVNTGIRKESSRRDGGDASSSVVSFIPVNLVQYLKSLAQSPHGETDRLDFVTARAQLLAINRWKGFYQLPEFQILVGSLEDVTDNPAMDERKYSEGETKDAVRVPTGNEQVPLEKGKLVIQDGSTRKRKEISVDGVSPSKKERRISDLMSSSHSKFSNGKTEAEGKAGRKLTSSSSYKKRKASDSEPDDSRVKTRKTSLSPVTKKQFSRVGESIRRVASQLAKSSPILKDFSKKNVGENVSNKISSRTTSEKSQRRKVIPPAYEILSQLYMASTDFTKGLNLISSVRFLSDFRNSFCLENSTSTEDKKSTGKMSGKQIGKKLSNSETSRFEGMEDVYWTDRIVQSSNEEQVLFEPETPNEKGTPSVEPEAALESGQKLDSKQETAVENFELAGKPEGDMDDTGEEECTPTALILNFTDVESVPSQSNLNNIFSRYGPLNESNSEVLNKSKRAKVVFKRRSDAETAFSRAGKFSIFGPSLVSYRLNYSPSLARKTSTSATKRSRKGATSLEGK